METNSVPIVIPLNKSSPKNKSQLEYIKQYDLKQNFFDPTKNSPPNNFIKNLEKRMSIYKFGRE